MPKINITKRITNDVLSIMELESRNYLQKVLNVSESLEQYQFKEPCLKTKDGPLFIPKWPPRDAPPTIQEIKDFYMAKDDLFWIPLWIQMGFSFADEYVMGKLDRVIYTDENGKSITGHGMVKKNSIEDISQSFLEQVTVQLTEQILELAPPGFKKILSNFHLELKTCLIFKADTWCFLPIRLHGYYAVSSTLWFKWKSLIPGKEYIETNEVIDDDSIHIELCTEQDIQKYDWLRLYSERVQTNMEWIKNVSDAMNDEKYYPKKRASKNNIVNIGEAKKKRIEKKEEPRFLLEFNGEDWPDVTFKFLFAKKITDADCETVTTLFADFVSQWNFEQEESGGFCIHYHSEAVKTGTKTCEMHVDFGSADAGVLDEVIQLYNKSDLPLKKLTFG